MLKNILLLASIFSLLSTIETYSDWRQYNYDTTYVDYNSIAISPNKKILAVGNKGRYSWSTDEGNSWFYSSTNNLNNLVLASAINDSAFIIIDEQNNAYITSDYGKNIEKLDFFFTEKITKIKFNNKFGIALGSNGAVFKSRDLGRNWTEIKLDLSAKLYDIAFTNNVAYIAGDILLKSVDDCTTFEHIESNNADPFQKIQIVDSLICLVDKKLNYYICNDMTKNWSTYNIDKNYSKIYSRPEIINFTQIDSKKAVIKVQDWYGPCTAQFNEYLTTNNGLSWEKRDVSSDINKVDMLNPNFGFAVGHSGEIFQVLITYGLIYKYYIKTTPLIINFYAINYSNENDILCTGLTWDTYFLTSSDGGKSWTNKKVDLKKASQFDLPLSDLETISYPGKNTFFLCSNRYIHTQIDENTTSIKGVGKLHKTTDMGETFTLYNNPDSEGWSDFVMQDNSNGYIQEASNFLKFTTDGGSTWERASVPEVASEIFHISSFKPGYYFVETYNSTIIEERVKFYKTSDYGKNWTRFNIQEFRNFSKFTFTDENNGYALYRYLISETPKAYGDGIFKTTDGGETWNQCYTTKLDKGFKNIRFSDINHGIAFSEDLILFTSDGGENWYEKNIEQRNVTDKIVDVIMPTPNKMVCLTDISIFVNDEIIVGISHRISKDEQDCLINPNPNHGNFNLQFNNTSSNNIKIEILDIYGKSVETLFEAYLEEGNHSIPLACESISSGVYFLSIKSATITITSKIIIIK